MRIAVISPIHWRTPPVEYGPWELIASLITEELVQRGHEVTLFATGDSITKAKLISVCPHPLFSEKGKKLEPKIYEYLHTALPFEHADQFDVIHNHYNVYPLAFSKLIQVPLVTTMHGFSSPGIVEMMKKYDHTHFVSISMADRSHMPNANWIANIYHGLNLDQYPFVAQPNGYLCYVGRISPDKGIHLAIEVASATGYPLKIAGLMEKPDYFATKIKPRLKAGHIEYLGEISEAEKKQLIAHANGFLHLNTYPEGFGLTLIEAMACGTPVIGMRLGSIPEVIADQETGYVVTNIEEAKTMVPKLAAINRASCRERVAQHFTVTQMVNQYENVFQKLLIN